MKAIFTRLILTILFALFISSAVYSQHKPKPSSQTTKTQARLEDKVRQFWFVMLTAGNNRSQDSITAAKIQEGHMANINRLYKEGTLKVAGPFGDDGKWLGIFIFDMANKEDVEKILQTDPAVASGRLGYEIHLWWTASVGSFAEGKPEKITGKK
jgi:uncharacterized protein YciI